MKQVIKAEDLEINSTSGFVLPWHQAHYRSHIQRFQKQRYTPIHLFKAPEYSGKKALALSLIQFFLCESKGEFEPCFCCHACHLFKAGTHPNVLILSVDEDHKTIKIDSIRELISTLQESPLYGSVRCILIHCMDDLLVAGSQALLKTLEEPPSNTYFFLLYRQTKPLLPTILSRCQVHTLMKPTQAQGLAWLQEKGELDSEANKKVLQFSEDRPLLALELLGRNGQSNARSKKNKIENQIHIPLSWRHEFLKQWIGGFLNPIQLAETALQYSYFSILDALILMLRDIQLIYLNPNLKNHSRHLIPDDILEKYFPSLSLKKINQAYEQLIQLRKSDVRAVHLNEKLQLESFFISWAFD